MSSRSLFFVAGATAGALTVLSWYRLRASAEAPVPSPRPALLPTPSPPNPALEKIFAEFGFPGPLIDVNYRASYAGAFNRLTRNPHWVAEYLTKERLAPGGGDRQDSAFAEDKDLPQMFRAHLQDYIKSGYDRGHLAPAADAKMSQEAMDQTFLLSNIAPQVGAGFNRDYWAHFENFVRELTKEFDEVIVLTGLLFLPKLDPDTNKWYVKYEVIGNPPNTAVPTHWYKVILTRQSNGEMSLGAFVLPNAPIPDATPLTNFSIPLGAIERSAGLELFSKLPDKYSLPNLCSKTTCAMKIRKFDNAKKNALKSGSK